MRPKVEATLWERLIQAIAHPARVVAWAIALGVLVGGYGGVSWVLVTALGALAGVVCGELAGRSRVRTPYWVGLAAVVALGGTALRGVMTTWAIVPSVFGPAFALWASLLLSLGLTVGAVVGLLRVLALRGPAFAAVELTLLGGLLAAAVASHRDGAVARPLWLSDFAWSLGVDPGRVLLVAGAGMTLLLAGLLLLGAERRKPGPGLLALPVLALLAWFVAARLPPVEPVDPSTLLGLDGEEGGGAAGAQGEAGGGGSQGGEGQQPQDAGDGGGAGTAQPQDAGGGGANGSAQAQGARGGESAEASGGGAGADASQGGGAGGSSQDGGGGNGQQDGGEGGGQVGQDGGGAGGDAQADGGEAGERERPAGEGDDAGERRDAPDPLDGGGSTGGDSPVAVVLIDDDHVPPSQVWYLRQDVLTRWNGTRLVHSELPEARRDVRSTFPVEVDDLDVTAPRTGPDDGPLRTAVHGSVSLLVEHPNPFAPEAVVQYAPRGNPNPARFVRSYAFTSHMLNQPYTSLVGRPLGDPAWSEALRAELLEVPPDPRYGELARSIVDALPEPARDDPFVRAAVVTQWIGDNMQYTKAERHDQAADPTASFLFGSRKGYCVHTAHASVFLWRALGIPSRVATGYAVEETHRRGSTLIVQGSYAHAWPELFVEGVGWVPLDVVPAENLDPVGDPPDEDELRALGEMARTPPPPAPDGPRRDGSWIWTWLGRTAAGALGTLALGVLVAHWAVKLWRRAAPLWVGPVALPRVGYRAALDLLAEAGHVREPGETREAFARRLAELPALERMTALHLRAALGRTGSTDSERRSEWSALLLRLRHELAASTPRWRRLLGLLDPTSVYRAR